MGYTTCFEGRFNIDKPLNDELYNFLIKFNETRRMARDLPEEYGIEGEFFVDGAGFCGQERESNIIDYNEHPKTQPSLWCNWKPSEDKQGIEWDEGEKFYDYIEWLEYLIKNFLAPKEYILNGMVKWYGEGIDDFGIIEIKNNIVHTHKGITKITSDKKIEEVATELMKMVDAYDISIATREKFVKRLSELVKG